MNSIDIFGVPVTRCASFDQFEEDFNYVLSVAAKFSVTFVNPHSVYNCEKSKHYKNLLERFDRVYCDGIGMVAAAKLFGYHLERLSFDMTSLSPFVFKRLSETKTKVYFVGGKEDVAEKAAFTIKTQFPHLNIIQTYSGYGKQLDSAKADILESGYSVVISGLGFQKQEEFLLSLYDENWNGVGITCGGYFDQVGEHNSYYPRWVDKYELRFLYRIFREPRRLARRYSVEYFPFIYLYIKKLFSA